MGHSAEYLTDPRAALSAAAEFNPDAAFLDIDMPHIDGFQLSMLLKQAFPGICVVAISAHDSDDLRRRGRESRFDAYVRKPVDVNMVESILRTIFSPPAAV